MIFIEKKCKLLFLLLFLLQMSIYAQDQMNYGISVGSTITTVNTIITVDDIKDADYHKTGRGLIGYHVGIFGNLPITSSWSAELEAGFELVRFRSYEDFFWQWKYSAY